MLSLLLEPTHWSAVAVPLVGLASTLTARLGQRSTLQAFCQVQFFCCLLLVGLSTLAAHLAAPSHGLLSGAVLGVMVLGAVWDPGARGAIDATATGQ